MAVIFLGLAALATTLAFRSALRHRLEPPLTTSRLAILVLLIVGAAMTAVLTRTDWLLVPLISAVFVVSVGWLTAKGT